MTYTVIETETFTDWLNRVQDRRAKALINVRFDRLRRGLLGDVKSVGDGVSELRIDHGPGYRIYFVTRQQTLIVLLCAGDKGSQSRDVARAKALAQDV